MYLCLIYTTNVLRVYEEKNVSCIRKFLYKLHLRKLHSVKMYPQKTAEIKY